MARGHTPTQMEQNMWDNGKMTSRMVLELKNGWMDRSIKVSTKMEQKQEKVSWSFWMAAFMRDNFSTMKSMVKVLILLHRNLRLVQKQEIWRIVAKQQDAWPGQNLMDWWSQVLGAISQWQEAWNWHFLLVWRPKVSRILERWQAAWPRRVLLDIWREESGRVGRRQAD